MCQKLKFLAASQWEAALGTEAPTYRPGEQPPQGNSSDYLTSICQRLYLSYYAPTATVTLYRLSSVSPGHLAWSRGLSTSQSAHHFMYINPCHRPLGQQNTYNYTTQYTLHYISIAFLLTDTLYMSRLRASPASRARREERTTTRQSIIKFITSSSPQFHH